jgi:hypothetical protein
VVVVLVMEEVQTVVQAVLASVELVQKLLEQKVATESQILVAVAVAHHSVMTIPRVMVATEVLVL